MFRCLLTKLKFLVDTAGIRSSKDEIEIEGLKRAKSNVDKADIIVYVVTKGFKKPHFIEGKDFIVVSTKQMFIKNQRDSKSNRYFSNQEQKHVSS